VGEVERIRPSLGSSFGHDLGHRIVSASDRQPKKHHSDEEGQASEDALELHSEEQTESSPKVVELRIETLDHLDLSA
jgi:hypothetical protein